MKKAQWRGFTDAHSPRFSHLCIGNGTRHPVIFYSAPTLFCYWSRIGDSRHVVTGADDWLSFLHHMHFFYVWTVVRGGDTFPFSLPCFSAPVSACMIQGSGSVRTTRRMRGHHHSPRAGGSFDSLTDTTLHDQAIEFSRSAYNNKKADTTKVLLSSDTT